MSNKHRISDKMMDLQRDLEQSIQKLLVEHFQQVIQLSLKEDTCTHCGMASTAITLSSVLTGAILTAEQGDREEALKLLDTLTGSIRETLTDYSMKNAKVTVVSSTEDSSELLDISASSIEEAADAASEFLSKIVANAKGNNRMN